jgi:hypothetical protein
MYLDFEVPKQESNAGTFPAKSIALDTTLFGTTYPSERSTSKEGKLLRAYQRMLCVKLVKQR